MYLADNESANHKGKNAAVILQGTRVPFDGERVYFRVNCTFRGNVSSGPEPAVFQYSLDGTNWTTIGITLNMTWTMTHFTGARFGLFNYATQEAGGYVDFDYFHVQ
jgi:beta-xylosidase